MTSIGNIIKEIIIPHRRGNIILNPEFVVLENAYMRVFLLGTDDQRMYRIDIYNIKNSLLKILRKKRPPFVIGEEPLGKIRWHDIEQYLDVKRPYPATLRRPTYPESLETKKEIAKHINEILDMDFIRKIGHNEIVETTTSFLITWNYGKSKLCVDFRGLKATQKLIGTLYQGYLMPSTSFQKPNT
ncbi:hypothetical protein O181_032101 [Austropuccinia psidii MF-1]|uniref:Uncharacterized protein n=1 Tax=Austropuccinia psidii MF-1 TaxID=1389203 RepID=A0A9Q3H5U4_9BASI|nr:hypothetical protein [Austropuccinia psidii MF-1]